MNIKYWALCCLAALSLLAPRPACAETGGEQPTRFNLGMGVGFISSEYEEMEATVVPLPVINSEGEHFYVRGLTGGLHIYKDSVHELSATLSYLPQSFTADKSRSHAMRRLDDRFATMMAGGSYGLTTPLGIFRAGISTDILGNNKGVLADFSYSYPLPLGGGLVIIPTVGTKWADANFMDYYYGVSASEARRSGLSAYEADAAFLPYANIMARITFTENWNAFVNGGVSFLTHEATDSPMVSDSAKYSRGMGAAYSF